MLTSESGECNVQSRCILVHRASQRECLFATFGQLFDPTSATNVRQSQPHDTGSCKHNPLRPHHEPHTRYEPMGVFTSHGGSPWERCVQPTSRVHVTIKIAAPRRSPPRSRISRDSFPSDQIGWGVPQASLEEDWSSPSCVLSSIFC